MKYRPKRDAVQKLPFRSVLCTTMLCTNVNTGAVEVDNFVIGSYSLIKKCMWRVFVVMLQNCSTKVYLGKFWEKLMQKKGKGAEKVDVDNMVGLSAH